MIDWLIGWFATELSNIQETPSGTCTEKHLQLELERLKKENHDLVMKLAELKLKDAAESDD